MENEIIYPLTIVHDRYGGVYSGGCFTAWNEDFHRVPKDVDGDDTSCTIFRDRFKQGKLKNYCDKPIYVGMGSTPQKALDDLMKKIK